MKPIIDISFYQDPALINYDLLASQVSGVILRACYSIYKDTKFDRHYQEFTRRGVPVGAYHYIIGSASIQAQADAFNVAVGLKDMRLGCWIDVEDTRANTKLYRKNVLDYAALQPDMGIYTSKGAWAAIMGGIYLNDRKLWVAHYTTNPYPLLPTGWDSWWLWQFTSSGRLPGYAGNLDTNRFFGDDADFAAWIGGEVPAQPDKLFDAKVTTTPPNRLKTRYTPAGTVRPEADWLPSQAIVPVYETSGTGWWRVAPEAWSSATWMQRVDDNPLPPITGDYAYYGAVYSQRDARWASHPLGTKSTIGANGCLMTCVSMVCNYFRHASNPIQLNNWLTANGGYLDGNLFLWAKVEELYPDMKFDGFVYNPTTAQIRAAIERSDMAGTLPIMYVDFDDSTPLIEMHWVLGIGILGEDVLIADPWTGSIGKLSEMYPKQVIRYGSYSRRAL